MFAIHLNIGNVVLEDSWDVNLKAAVSAHARRHRQCVSLALLVFLIGADDAVGGKGVVLGVSDEPLGRYPWRRHWRSSQ